MDKDIILLGHGSGGRLTHRLIKELFYKHLNNPWLDIESDSSLLGNMKNLAMTTDSYVVDPIFFPGGNIGKLAVSGTVNDLSVSGADPRFLSAGFIIEEGFSLSQLEQVVKSMAEEANSAGVQIVTGDTKVVKKGQCDKLFINTAGIGEYREELTAYNDIIPGDVLLINGFLGDHAIAVLGAREKLSFEEPVLSDVRPLNHLIGQLVSELGDKIKLMRDVTRGGLATILNEICGQSGVGIEVNEHCIPVHSTVRGVCELYGYDALYLANEGKLLLAIKDDAADKALEIMQAHQDGKEAAIIGRITREHAGKALLKSEIGGTRIIDMLSGEMLPRIC